MAFGSFWQGIFLVELNPQTGLRSDTSSTPRRLAWAESIEAPCLARRGKDYYLFVNWGLGAWNLTGGRCQFCNCAIPGRFADKPLVLEIAHVTNGDFLFELGEHAE
jgi:hypothetical protein